MRLSGLRDWQASLYWFQTARVFAKQKMSNASQKREQRTHFDVSSEINGLFFYYLVGISSKPYQDFDQIRTKSVNVIT